MVSALSQNDQQYHFAQIASWHYWRKTQDGNKRVSFAPTTLSRAVVFLKTKERVRWFVEHGAGFPFAGEWHPVYARRKPSIRHAAHPHRPDVQRRIIDERSPMAAKMRSKPYRHDSAARLGNQVRVNVMRWCLRVKLAQNWDIFSELLLDTGERSRRASRKDDFWGAKPVDERTLVGMNVLGRLLMELREAVKSKPRRESSARGTSSHKDFLLGGHPIKPVASGHSKRCMKPWSGPRGQPRRRQKPGDVVSYRCTRRCQSVGLVRHQREDSRVDG